MRAIALRPKAIAAFQLKLYIANSLGKDSEKRKILDAATSVCPECFRIRSKYLIALEPRWGGSFEKMEQAATEAQALATKNPRLKVLLGYADEERAFAYREQKKFAAAFDAIDRALAVADYHRFHEERASILQATDRNRRRSTSSKRPWHKTPERFVSEEARTPSVRGKAPEGTGFENRAAARSRIRRQPVGHRARGEEADPRGL
jgi:hypothetical protein